jgi:hypothetical protein
MPKILIDLDTKETDKLKALATQHGHKVKPFIEYLLKLQTGSLQIPTARPVKIPPQGHTAEVPKGIKVEAPQEVKSWKPNRNEGAYKVKVSDRIYSDGESFRMNLFGSVHYFQTLAEAEVERDK